MNLCLNCGHGERHHAPHLCIGGPTADCDCPGFRDEPTDNEMMNRPGVEGGIGYPLGAEAMSEHDWRL